MPPREEHSQAELERLRAALARAEQEAALLRQSRDEYSNIFALSLDLICIADIETASFVKVNPAFTAVLGYSEAELLSRSFVDFVHPDDVRATIEVLDTKLSRGVDVLNFVNRYRCADGSYRWLEWVSRPILERGVAIAIARDTTVQRKAELALRESEDFIRAVMDHLPIGIAVNSDAPPVRFHYMNDNFARFYRTTREALADPDAFWEAVYEDPVFRAQMKERIFTDSLSGDPERMLWEEVPLTRKGEGTSFVTARNTHVPERNLIISSVWDVTEQRIGADKLKETKRLLEESQSIAQLGGWEYDVASGRLSFTDTTYQIFGLDRNSARLDWELVLALCSRESKVALEQAFERALTRAAAYDLELEIIRADGSSVWVRTIGKPWTQDERVVRITGFFVNISARRRAEADRTELQSQLAQAQKMDSVGRLAGGVAHDFNNMLGVILGHAEMALEDLPPDAPLRPDLEEIRRAASRSAQLTSQLLAFARRQPVAPKVLDINTVIEESLQMLRRLLGESIKLEWEPGDFVWSVKMDPGQVDQLLMNLCLNARDAIDEGGTIRIETSNVVLDDRYAATHPGSNEGEYVQLRVQDDGHGMDAETVERIFEPFFTTKPKGRGTGLGLATVYGIVRQNNGHVDVISTEAVGTEFITYLPRSVESVLDAQRSKASLAPAPVAAPAAEDAATILVVEDERMNLRLMGTLLRKLGYRVLEASTPFDALTIASAPGACIDLVVTDVIMPEMNGRLLVQRLLEIHPQVKSLFMSGYTADVIAHQGVLEDGIRFIQKPFSQKSLAAAVKNALEGTAAANRTVPPRAVEPH